MRLLKNQDLYSRQIRNITSAETSNVAMVVQAPQVFATYYSIDADLSTAVNGFNNVHEYIGPHSSIVYNRIENLPMAGVESLVMTSEYDDEIGFDVNFTSQGIIFPNTITPKPGDVFLFPESVLPTIFIVTNVTNTVVRSNPFVEITFRLLSQAKQDVEQLNKQVKDDYTITVSAIGTDKTLLIKKTAYFEIKDHLKNYIDLANFYVSTFYDKSKACFVYTGIYDADREAPVTIVDVMLWKLMYERGIIVYDELINYALNNYKFNFNRVYVDRPILIDDHTYRTSIFERLLSRNHTSPFFEKRFPVAYTENSQITKFAGANLIHIEEYIGKRSCNALIGNFTIFDDEFIDRILHDQPYAMEDIRVSATMRNAIIDHFNDREVNFLEIYIPDEKSIENFYLLPMILDMYKHYIETLQVI